jgi:hypothetical protein
MTGSSIRLPCTAPETFAFAVRVHRLPEIISMGCARFTVVTTRTRAKFHGEHYDTISIDRSPLTFWTDLLIRTNGPSE